MIAAGGGGCACSVPGNAQPAGGSQRGVFSLFLFAFGGALLLRRRRPRAAKLASQLALLGLLALGLLGSGCKVDTFCLDCPQKGMGNKEPGSDGGAAGMSGGGGANGGGGSGSGGGTAAAAACTAAAGAAAAAPAA